MTRSVAAMVAIVALTGCAGSGGQTSEQPQGSTAIGTRSSPADDRDTRSAEDGGPLLSLEPCTDPPAPLDPGEASVKGLTAPDGTVVSEVIEKGATTQVHGFTATTPVEIRRYYQNNPDIEVLQIEDEIVESEGLVVDKSTGYRTLFKANAVCQTGSTMLFVVAAEVPEPSSP